MVAMRLQSNGKYTVIMFEDAGAQVTIARDVPHEVVITIINQVNTQHGPLKHKNVKITEDVLIQIDSMIKDIATDQVE